MKKLILIAIMLLQVSAVYSQKFHPDARRWEEDGVRKFEKSLYNGEMVFGNGDIYIISRDLSRVILSNTKNRLYGTEKKRLDGKEIIEDDPFGDMKFFAPKNIQLENNIIRKHLGFYSPPGSMISFEFIIDMNGRIKEVVFKFFYDSPQSTVPPMVYSRLEKELKEMVQYIVPEEERIYNFIRLYGRYRF